MRLLDYYLQTAKGFIPHDIYKQNKETFDAVQIIWCSCDKCNHKHAWQKTRREIQQYGESDHYPLWGHYDTELRMIHLSYQQYRKRKSENKRNIHQDMIMITFHELLHSINWLNELENINNTREYLNSFAWKLKGITEL